MRRARLDIVRCVKEQKPWTRTEERGKSGILIDGNLHEFQLPFSSIPLSVTSIVKSRIGRAFDIYRSTPTLPHSLLNRHAEGDGRTGKQSVGQGTGEEGEAGVGKCCSGPRHLRGHSTYQAPSLKSWGNGHDRLPVKSRSKGKREIKLLRARSLAERNDRQTGKVDADRVGKVMENLKDRRRRSEKC